jgi:hypothetical protein
MLPGVAGVKIRVHRGSRQPPGDDHCKYSHTTTFKARYPSG